MALAAFGGPLRANSVPPHSKQPAPSAGVPALPAVPAQELVQRASVGEPVDLSGVTVEGDLNLQPIGTLPGPLRCQACRFTGSLNADDVTFNRVVDFTGSLFEGAFEIRAAAFKDRAIFDRSHFQAPAVLTSTRFSDDLSFRDATFRNVASFERMLVGGNALFSGTRFEGDASFSGGGFGSKANFSQANFSAGVDFSEATFSGPCTFAGAQFSVPAHFEAADLRADGNFRFIFFHSDAAFDRLTAAGPLHFDATVFEGQTSFSNLTSSTSVSLVGIRVARGASLFLDQLSVHDLSMDVQSVQAIRGSPTQERILELIERSAQGRGDLATANDARFRKLTLKSNERADLPSLLDSVFYRTIAGYLVRASHPLAVFGVLLAAAGTLRSLPRLRAMRRSRATRWVEEPGRGRLSVLFRWPHFTLLAAQKSVTAVLSGLATAVTVAFRAKADIDIDNSENISAYFVAMARWSEFLAYKVLIVIFVLSLGNSNATIRQILDSIRA